MPELGKYTKESDKEFQNDLVYVIEKEYFFKALKENELRVLITNYYNMRAYVQDMFKINKDEYKAPELSGVWDLLEDILDQKKNFFDVKKGTFFLYLNNPNTNPNPNPNPRSAG